MGRCLSVLYIHVKLVLRNTGVEMQDISSKQQAAGRLRLQTEMTQAEAVDGVPRGGIQRRPRVLIHVASSSDGGNGGTAASSADLDNPGCPAWRTAGGLPGLTGQPEAGDVSNAVRYTLPLLGLETSRSRPVCDTANHSSCHGQPWKTSTLVAVHHSV
jgi:hypothetical protein